MEDQREQLVLRHERKTVPDILARGLLGDRLELVSARVVWEQYIQSQINKTYKPEGYSLDEKRADQFDRLG